MLLFLQDFVLSPNLNSFSITLPAQTNDKAYVGMDHPGRL